MTTENTTPNRGYQLPFGDNELADDVLRLISALSAIDIDIAALLVSVGQRALLVHQHVIADTTGLQAALESKQDESEKGIANGYASLDATGKIPATQLPAALFGAMAFQSDWNANTNTPTIPAASAANKGQYYVVSVAGTTTVSGINDWGVGDWIVSRGDKWIKVDNTDAVISVAGLFGVITAAALKTALAIAIADVTGLQTALNGKMDVAARLAAAAPVITDSNTALENGWYRGNAVANGPSAGYFLFEVIAWSGNDIMQTAYGWLGAGAANLDTWRRFKQSGTWSAWFKLQPGQAEQDARYLRLAADALLQAGIFNTPVDDGTKASGTYQPSPAGGNWRRAVFNGAVVFAAPAVANGYTMIVQVINGATAGAVTFSGFNVVDGDPYVTTNGAAFLFQIVVTTNYKTLTIKRVA